VRHAHTLVNRNLRPTHIMLAAHNVLDTHVRTTHSLAMKLALWLDANDLSDAEFGRRIGKAHSTVLRLKRGEIRPSLETVEAIRTETNGSVTADDFMSPFEAAVPDEQQGATEVEPQASAAA
jgi:transcriptional regulator with XRE-family HTH domain